MRSDGANREEILKRRAARLAATDDEKDRRIAARVAVVGTGGQRLGIAVESIREIVPLPPITELPSLPRWLLGMTHVRGEIVGVVDLASILGASAEHFKAMALVEGSGGPVGLAVESVLGFRDVFEDELSEQIRSETRSPIRAMTKDFVSLIDVQRLPVVQSERR